MQIEKLIEAAEELRLASLRASEQNIYRYSDVTDDFQISSITFQELKGDRDYTVKVFTTNDDGTVKNYVYSVKIAGFTFIALSPFLIYPGDEKKLKEDKDV